MREPTGLPGLWGTLDVTESAPAPPEHAERCPHNGVSIEYGALDTTRAVLMAVVHSLEAH